MQQAEGCSALPGRRTAAAYKMQAVLVLCLCPGQINVQQQQHAAESRSPCWQQHECYQQQVGLLCEAVLLRQWVAVSARPLIS